MENDIFRGLGVEITLKNPEDFLKVKETLTRIGIASDTKKILYQSCHILHKRERYAIIHFKELFVLDGKNPTHTQEDIARRDFIVSLLADWDLIRIVDDKRVNTKISPTTHVKVISFSEKRDWKLVQKYSIGK